MKILQLLLIISSCAIFRGGYTQINLLNNKSALNYFLENNILKGNWYLKSFVIYNSNKDSLILEQNLSFPNDYFWRFNEEKTLSLSIFEERFYKRNFPCTFYSVGNFITVKSQNSISQFNVKYLDLNSLELEFENNQNFIAFNETHSYNKINLYREKQWEKENELFGQWKLLQSDNLACEQFYERVDSNNIKGEFHLIEFDANGSFKTLDFIENRGSSSEVDYLQDKTRQRIYVLKEKKIKCYRYEFFLRQLILTELFEYQYINRENK